MAENNFYRFLSRLPRRDRLLFILLHGYHTAARDHPESTAALAQIYEPEIQNVVGLESNAAIVMEKSVMMERSAIMERSVMTARPIMTDVDKKMDEKFGKWDSSDDEIGELNVDKE
jgi:hypothetical protein